MARSTPVNSGYTIINGSGTGPNGSRIDVWIEYKIGTQDIANNRTYVNVEFYACLRSGQSSGTWGSSGRSATLTVDGTGTSSSGGYDFRSTSYADRNHYGSFAGWIVHSADGTKSLSVSGTFSTPSSWITGGNVSGTIALPTIPRGMCRVRMGGVWRSPTTTYVRVAGVWRQGQVWVRAGGTWRRGI